MSDTLGGLQERIARFLVEASEGFVRRFCPDDRLPTVVGGYKSFDRTDSALLQHYGRLARLGVETLAGRPVRDRMAAQLAAMAREKPGAERPHTWWCLFLAEAVAATGATWADHPLASAMPADMRARLERAMDSSHVVDREKRSLIGKPNNYWIVMAMLQLVRQRLGFADDPRILSLSLEKSAEVLLGNPSAYLDDSEEGRGRYDTYTYHALITAEPLWDRFPPQQLSLVLGAHERLLRATFRPDGGSVAWGRSVELSINSNMEFCAAMLRHRRAQAPAVLLGILRQAFDCFVRDWWKDDAIAAHRHRMTHWYRGEMRLLEYSLNALASLAWVVEQLRAAEDAGLVAETRESVLFPEQDEWIEFDARGPGVWCYRRGGLAFQLPVVDGFTSDYVAAPLAPGVFEQPVDKAFACGVPNVFYDGKRYLPLRRPAGVKYERGRLSWVSECFSWFEDFDWWKKKQDVGGRREVTVRVVGEALEVEEKWSFEKVPDALAVQFAETLAPLRTDWQCDAPFHQFEVGVHGMREWRSYWNEIRKVHQIDIVPARQVKVRYRISRA